MNRNISTAPAAAPMWDDEVAQPRLVDYMRGCSFHPDDVPEFGIAEAREFMAEILVDDFGWDRKDHATVAYGDSGSPVRFEVWIGGQHTIEITEYEGAQSFADRTTRFEGELRMMFPRALAYLGSLQTQH